MPEFIETNDITDIVLLHGPLTPVQQKRIEKLVAVSRHTKKYVMNFLKKEAFDNLSIDDKIDALNVCDKYNVSATTMIKFVDSRYSVSQAANMIEFSQLYNPGEIAVFRVTPSGPVPNLAEHLGYDNILFLDEISGNYHDPILIEQTISTIADIIEGTGTRMGLAEVIHGIKNQYSKHSSIMLETATRLVVNSVIPSELIPDYDSNDPDMYTPADDGRENESKWNTDDFTISNGE